MWESDPRLGGYEPRDLTVCPICRIAELPFCGTFIGVISQPHSLCRRAYLPSIGRSNVTRRTVRILALVPVAGLEPAIFALSGRCSAKLSYTGIGCRIFPCADSGSSGTSTSAVAHHSTERHA